MTNKGRNYGTNRPNYSRANQIRVDVINARRRERDRARDEEVRLLREKVDGLEEYRREEEGNRKKERKGKLIEYGTRSAVDAAAAAAVLTTGARDALFNTGQAIGEGIDGLRNARRLINPSPDNAAVEKYLNLLPGSVSKPYLDYVHNGTLSTYKQALKEFLDSAGRASEKVPGANSKPIKGLRDIKAEIIERTRGIFTGEKEKEETSQRGTDQYQRNFNQVAATRSAAIKRLEEIDGKISKHVQKIAESEARYGKPDGKGLEVLGKLVESHNQISGLIQKVNGLEIGEMYRGLQDQNYQTVIQLADQYHIRPKTYNAEGIGAVALGTAAAVAITDRLAGRYIGKATKGAYHLASKIHSTVKGPKKK